jgi:dephospho-CoA kinase
MKIAVVGQICTGKTTVLKYLNNKYPYLKIIITDQLVKKLHQNKEVRAKLNDIFPELLKLSLKKRLN